MPAWPLLYVCLRAVFFSSTNVFSPGVLGNIFLRAGGVTTRGMNDLLSARGEVGLEVFGVAPGVFLCIPGENFGIRLFLSADVVEKELDMLGPGDLASGDGARLLPGAGLFG